MEAACTHGMKRFFSNYPREPYPANRRYKTERPPTWSGLVERDMKLQVCKGGFL